MSDDQKLKETLSALMDGEVGKGDQLELRRLVRSLNEHPELVDTYRRYIEVRATINGEPALRPSASLLANIRHAIDDDNMEEELPETGTLSAVATRDPKQAHRWLKALGSVAVAASVAVVAVMLVQTRPADPALAQAPAVAQSDVARETPDTVVAHNNRILNPNVLTVSAGSHNALPASASPREMNSGCVLDAHRSDQSNVIWEKPLPSGYALCKQNSTTHRCDVVSEKVSCYLR